MKRRRTGGQKSDMQWVVIAYDGEDPDAGARRQKARPAHLEVARRLKEEGRLHTGGAILDDSGAMVGSVVIVDFPTRAAVDQWLQTDPYATENVWQRVEIRPFRLAL